MLFEGDKEKLKSICSYVNIQVYATYKHMASADLHAQLSFGTCETSSETIGNPIAVEDRRSNVLPCLPAQVIAKLEVSLLFPSCYQPYLSQCHSVSQISLYQV